MKIYTKTGDNQFTSTILAENVKKSDLIIEVWEILMRRKAL